MSAELVAVIAVIVAAMAFDFTNGFHDAANAIATSVSTRALTPGMALLVAAIGNFVGAHFGAKVAKTVGDGLVSLPPGLASLGVVFAGVLGAIGWNLLTWYFGLPSSSSHALFGGLVGATLFAAGGHVKWGNITDKVILPMLLSPVVGFVLGAIVMFGLLWTVKGLTVFGRPAAPPPPSQAPTPDLVSVAAPSAATAPSALPSGSASGSVAASRSGRGSLAGPVGGTPTASRPVGGTPTASRPVGGTPTASRPVGGTPTASRSVGGRLARLRQRAGAALAPRVFGLRRRVYAAVQPKPLNRFFRGAQTVSAAAMAVGHGMQDAAKTMGIIVLALYTGGLQSSATDIPWWVYYSSATVLALGTYSGGWRIIRTLGRRIIHLGPPEGFAAETVASSVLYYNALVLGAPISTTQTITSAIMGVGVTKRMSAVRWGVAGNIVVAWVFTFPGAGVLAGIAYFVVRPLF